MNRGLEPHAAATSAATAIAPGLRTPLPSHHAVERKTAGRAFTADLPRPIQAERRGDAWWMEADGRELRLSNLNKLFWPDEGYTKGDLIAYYYNVAELILPHLRDRPLTMKRMPDGLAGGSTTRRPRPRTRRTGSPVAPSRAKTTRRASSAT